jgi:hypothetical protein
MVEDNGVKDRMNKMEVALANFELDGSLRRQVQRQSYCLATALKASIASNWTVDFGKTDGTPTVQSSAKAPDQNYCNDPVVALPQK